MRYSLLLMISIFIWQQHSTANTAANVALNVEDTSTSNAPPPSRWKGGLFIEPKAIKPNQKTLKMRIEAEKNRPEIAEPIVLRLKTTELRPLLTQLATDSVFQKLSGSDEDSFRLMQKLESRLDKKTQENLENIPERPIVAFLTLTLEDLNWLDLGKLSQTLAYSSVTPFIPIQDVRALKNNEPLAIQRWASHFGSRFNAIRERSEQWLSENPNAIQMPFTVLLPNHMKNLLGRYSPFRGRNCFATALQFADQNIILSRNVNMVRETGHSPALINHDEFSHALWLAYDELSQEQANLGLEFGDLIALVDSKEADSYTSFKHAVIHIAGDIFFHKPSKSAASPIEFVRWKDLLQTWNPLVKQLGARYFRRRPSIRLNEQSSELAIEKIKWNR